MIKLAICDDDISAINALRLLLSQYADEHNQKLDCVSFRSPLDLLAEIEQGIRFDVLFLDILMPGENGMEAAAEIRERDNNVKIIFLTSSSEFAVQSYAVGAFYYQLKPIDRGSIFRLMDSVISSLENEQKRSIILRCKGGITRIDLRHLEFCEIIHRTLFIHLADGTVLESIGSLDDLTRQLEPYGGFLRPHRSFLVNLNYVQNLSYKAITMSCLTQIPIPRGKYQELKDAYLEHAFRNRQVTV